MRWSLVVEQYEMKRRKVLTVSDRRDGVSDPIERPIERRLRRDDLAALHVLQVALLANPGLPAFLPRGCVRPRRFRLEAQDVKKPASTRGKIDIL